MQYHRSFHNTPMFLVAQFLTFMVVLLLVPHLCYEDTKIQLSDNAGKHDSYRKDLYSGRQLQDIVPEKCNVTLYKLWKQETYYGQLSSDANFWRYQTQPQIVLTNELALELSLRGCKRLFSSLYYYKAGRMGPITIQDAYKIMCRPYCLENDELHQKAMLASGCSCIELSTPSDDVSYTKEGDWCYHNTGRLLCDMLGYCGIWDCRLDDFMCPRYEWNKKYIDYKGPGTCVRGAATKRSTLVIELMVLATAIAHFLLW